MAFDFKKEYKDLYRPKAAPSLIEVPEIQFLAVRGQGDPNQPDGAYQKALEVLYGLAYTLKMSKMGSRAIEGYFDYVVPRKTAPEKLQTVLRHPVRRKEL